MKGGGLGWGLEIQRATPPPPPPPPPPGGGGGGGGGGLEIQRATPTLTLPRQQGREQISGSSKIFVLYQKEGSLKNLFVFQISVTI